MPVPAAASIRRLVPIAVGFVLAVLSCGRDATGPDRTAPRYAHGVSFNPIFPSVLAHQVADLVPFNRVRIVLRHADGTIAVDTLINFPDGVDEVPVSLIVPLAFGAPDTGEPLALTLAYVNAAGDTVFRGGPTTVTVLPSLPGASPPPVDIPVTYTGPGATAASILISPRSATVLTGDPFSFTAVAKDASGNVLPGTPMVWTSLDPSLATITSPNVGAGVAGSLRGTAHISAQLLTGPSDNVTVSVMLRASAIAAVSGSSQSATISTQLPQPLVARVTASDGVPVSGIAVTFAVATGGGVVGTPSAVSDANGLVQTTWQLGAVVGPQTVSATASGLTGSPVIFTATALPPPSTQLTIATLPTSSTAGSALPVIATVRDASGNVSTTFTGAVTITIGSNPAGGTLSGTTTVNAVGGVATFSGVSINRSGTGYTLVATSGALSAATSNAFSITPGPAVSITAESGNGQSGGAGQQLANPFVARVFDAFGNGVPNLTVTWAVTGGGGTLTAPTTVTDANGRASSTLTLGVNVGGNSAVASTAGVAVSAGFTATSLALVATKLAFIQQPPATVGAGAAIAPSLVVQAQDANGNPVASFTGNVTMSIGTNPGASTLGGTLTVAAVGGNATFTNLTLNNIAAGYTLSAASGALTVAVSNTFSVIAGPPTQIAIDSGNVQSGVVGTSLLNRLVVRVQDAAGNLVPGVAVTWAVASGGGTLFSTLGVTDALGRARTGWTLGATVGAQSLTATSAGLTGSPATFTATGTVSVVTWTGATNTNWGTATNWNPAVVPGALDSVVIVAITNQPVLGASFTIKALTMGLSSSLQLGVNQLTINGNLDAQSGTVSGGSVILNGTGSMRGNVLSTVNLGAGVRTLTGGFNALTVNVTGGATLNLNGNTLALSGDFTTTGTGVLQMVNAADQLVVPGNVSFGGGDETGLITAGAMVVQGNSFVTSGIATSFVASGTNTVTFGSGTVGYAISMGALATSTFQNVIFSGTGTVSLNTGIVTTGNVLVNQAVSGNASTIGGTLTDVNGLFQPTGVTFTGAVPISATTPAITSAVTFTGAAGIQANLTVNGNLTVAGAGGLLSLNAHTLTVTGSFTTAAGGRLTMTAAGDALNINGSATFGGGSTSGLLTNGSISLGANFTQINSGTGLEYAATVPHSLILNGSGSQAITFASPDTATLVPACAASCFAGLTSVKTAGTITFTTAASARGNMVINAGPSSVVAIGAAGSPKVITVGGNTTTIGATPVHFTRYRTTGNIAFGASTVIDSIGFSGTAAQTVPAGTYGEVTFLGAPTIAGNITITGNVTVANGGVSTGVLAPNTHTVTVNGNLITANGGVVSMGAALDSLKVLGSVTFGGGSTLGTMTAGTINFGGNFVQTGATTFAPTGTHKTVANGAALQTVSFADPVNSFFRRFFVTKPAGAGQILRLLSNVLVTDSMLVQNGSEVVSLTTQRLQVQGRFRFFGGASSPTVHPFALEMTAFAPEMDSTFIGAARVFPDTLVFLGAANYTIPFSNYTGFKSIRVSTSGIVDMFGGSANDTLSGDLHVTSGRFRITGISSTIVRKFRTTGTGALEMSGGTPLLVVRDSAIFAGGTVNPLLTAGTLRVEGNFVQSALNSASSFNADPPHTLEFAGTAAQSVSFASPGLTPVLSHVGNLKFSNTVGVSFLTDVMAHVLVDPTAGTQEPVFGNGNQLTIEGVNVTNILFDNTRVNIVDNQTVTAFNTVTFQNYPTNPDILTVARSTAIPTFNTLVFPIVGFTGRYVVANDPNGATGGVMTVSLLTSVPVGGPGALCLRSNGALINWNGTNILTC